MKREDQRDAQRAQLLLEFERVTSLELLPAVYRENPDAEVFTERFLSLFDRSVEELEGFVGYRHVSQEDGGG